MPKYAWKDNYPKPLIDADVFGGTVERLEETLNRPVAPRDVVEEAAKPNSPIRSAVLWDDKIAGDKYRLQQARELLGGLQLVHVRMADGTRESGRALYNITKGNDRGYSSVRNVMSDSDLRTQILLEAKVSLERYLQRFRHTVLLAKYLPNLELLVEQIQADIEAINAEARRTEPKRRRRRGETEVTVNG